jgi:hypothetical protein
MTDLCRWAATTNVFTINSWDAWWDAVAASKNILEGGNRLGDMVGEEEWDGPGTYRLLVIDERRDGRDVARFRLVKLPV